MNNKRDTDCVPMNRKTVAGNDDKRNVDTSGAEIDVVFQEGYGVESTFLSEPDKLARMLDTYYGSTLVSQADIRSQLDVLNNAFSLRVKDITDPIHNEWKQHFERQMKARSGRAYTGLTPTDVLVHINPDTVQYIMTKGIMSKYLGELHDYVIGIDSSVTNPKLTPETIFSLYYSWMTGMGDMFNAHKDILDRIYS